MAVTCEGKGARTRWIEVRTARDDATRMSMDGQGIILNDDCLLCELFQLAITEPMTERVLWLL